MKKNLKRIICLALVILNLLPSINVYASSSFTEEFAIKVEETEEYINYKTDSMQTIVNNVVETSEGLRKVLMYEDKETGSTLVFICDRNNEIIYSGIIEYKDDKVILTDFAKKTSEVLNDNYLPQNTDCRTYTCVRRQTRTSITPLPGCNSFIGRECTPLLLLPAKGVIAYAVCRAGVFILCLEVNKNEICVEHDYVPYCEY